MRIQRFENSILVRDNINDFPASVWRDAKYDEIRAEMNHQIGLVDASMQEEQDAYAVGAEVNPDKIDALVQQRHDFRRVKGPAARAALDALGDDNEAISNFNVKEAFDNA